MLMINKQYIYIYISHKKPKTFVPVAVQKDRAFGAQD